MRIEVLEIVPGAQLAEPDEGVKISQVVRDGSPRQAPAVNRVERRDVYACDGKTRAI